MTVTQQKKALVPDWPLELENFEVKRSGTTARLACKHCGNRIRSYPVIGLDVMVFVALRHWHQECPKRLAEARS